MNNPKKNNATMKKFIVKLKSDNSVLGIFDTKGEASKFVTEAIDGNQIDTVFDVVCEEKDIDDYPLTFGDACKFLGIPEDAIVLTGGNEIGKSAVAFYKLAIIAKAWNKIDGFVPDFSNAHQFKYFPWFLYKTKHAGFVCTGTGNSFTSASAGAGAAIGSRLCFASESVAKKFGETFTALYNEMFL